MVTQVTRGFLEYVAEASSSPLQLALCAYTCLSTCALDLRDFKPQLFHLCQKVQAVFEMANACFASTEASFVIGAVFGCTLPILQKPATLLLRSLQSIVGNDLGATIFGGTLGGTAGLLCTGALFGLYFLARKIVELVNPLLNDQTIPRELNQEIPLVQRPKQSVALDPLPRDNFFQDFFTNWPKNSAQICSASRIISQIALLILGKVNPLLCTINILSLGYGIWKFPNQNCLVFSQKFPNFSPNVFDIAQVTANYFFPLVKDHRRNEECAICLESTSPQNNPRVFFCPDKSYHVKCLTPFIFSKSPSLLSGWQFTHKTITTYENNLLVSEKVTYQSSLPRSNLPSCPDCRRNPAIDHQLYLTVRNTLHGDCESGLVTLRG